MINISNKIFFVFFYTGKVDVKSLSRKNKSLDKQQRRHQAKQVRNNKRGEVLEKKRKLGTESSPPHLIVRFSFSLFILNFTRL